MFCVLIGMSAVLTAAFASKWHGQAAYFHARLRRAQVTLDDANPGKLTQESDFVSQLRDIPLAALVMQTMQFAAVQEGGRVQSLQVEDRPGTDAELARRDMTMLIDVPYPSVLIILREVLHRYPGATLRKLELAPPIGSGAGMGSSPTTVQSPANGAPVPSSATRGEARVVLSFWSRPIGLAVSSETAVPVTASRPAGVAPGH
jgi:hypothetical protein